MKQYNILGGFDELEIVDNELEIKKRDMRLPSYWLMPIDERTEKDLTKRIDNLIKRICESFNVSKKELMSKRRFRPFVDARNVGMYILHKHYNLSSTAAGKVFGKDHSTVLHACKSIEGFIEFDKELKQKINYLK
jgi:chromosomal replication initiation ATPase DnaA